MSAPQPAESCCPGDHGMLGRVGYLPGMWRDFGTTVGSLAGALTGLLFVAVSGGTLLVLGRRAGHDPASRVARYIDRASPNMVTAVLLGVAGLTFLLKAGGGLYWMIPAVLACLIGGVINAWLFLLRVPAE